MKNKTYLELKKIETDLQKLTIEGDVEINHLEADKLLRTTLHHIGCEYEIGSKEQSVISMILSYYNMVEKWYA